MSRVAALIRKEWEEVARNRMVLGSLLLTPLLLTGLAVGSMVPLASAPELGEADAEEIAALAGALCEGLDGTACMQVWLSSMHRLLYLVMPTVLPSVMASYSVVGEKSERTLEPLLATPITTVELLGAKCVAAVVPAVLATWVAAAVHLVAMRVVLVPAAAARLASWDWIAALGVTVPLLALLSVLVAVLVSSRSVDPRSAQQVSGLVVLPIVGMVLAQAFGVSVFSPALLGLVTAVVAAIDLGLGWFAVQLFERETILTRWSGL